MDVLASVTNAMVKRVNERVDGVDEKVGVCLKRVEDCVGKVDDFDVGAGVCYERLSVCENKVRDCASKETMNKMERLLRNELRDEREKRIQCERELRSLGRQMRELKERLDERERERDGE